MAPVANCSTSNFCVQPRIPYTLRNESNVKRTKFHGEVRRPILVPVCPPFLWSLSLQFSQNVRVKPLRHKSKFQIFTTLGTDAIVVEDADSTAAVGDSTLDDETSYSVSIDPPVSVETGGDASSKPRVVASSSPPVKRARPGRKSDMPPLKNEDLVPGAAFTGKVRSIHPFGAFVDIGAFTDGLVHVSRLSDSFVKDVADVVSIGQEVTVKIVEANMETGRISLSMRERDDAKNQQQRRRDTNSTTAVKSEDRPSEQDRSRTPTRTRNSAPRREFKQKPSNFVQGEILEGTVKKLTRSGAIISLPEGEEGFLPSTEEADVYGSILGSSSLQVDQEVSVRVLRISRGAATLTMKTEEKVKDGEIIARGVVYKATNPFELAFRKNKVIASFLDERDRAQKPPETKSESVDIQLSTGIELSVDTEVLEDGILLPTNLESVAAEQTDFSSSVTDLNIDSFTPQEASLAALEKHDTTSEEVVVVVAAAEDPTLSLASNNAVVLDDKEELPSVDAMLVGEASIIEAKDNEPETVVEGTIISEVSISSTLDKGDGDATTIIAAAAGQDPDLSLLSTDALPELQEVMPVGEASISTTKVDESETVAQGTIVEETWTSSTLDRIEEDTITISTEASETTATQDSISISPTLSDVAYLVAPAEEKGDSIEGGVVGSADVLAESNSSSPPSPQEETAESAFSTLEKEKVEASAATDTDAANVNELVVASEEIANDSKSDLSADTSVVEEKVILTFAVFENEKVTEPIQLGEVQEGDGNNVGNGAASIEDIDEGSLLNTDMGPIPLYEEQEVMEALNGASSSNSSNEAETKAVVSPALVKQLREETGAGMMDCKKALAETNGDIIKAQEFLRKKGLAGAEKKFSRVTAEGRIGSYIHDNRIGVMIEVNCETDFVSRGEIFKELVDDLAMQVAACTQVEYLSTEDVPEEFVNKEREIEIQKEDLMKKPEQIRGRIVEGRIKKRVEELALLEQPFIKDDKLVVKDLVKQKISTIGENIKVRRFIKYILGEGLQKKSQDFAAEVAAQTASKMAPAPAKAEPTPNAEKSVEEKKPAAAISAALVKQLREETGAGMMDCKKALSETDGDLEKAQEYLRKKGLSSAEKKSGRLAAEGRIGSYIHDNRIGVLIEVNCETDFVARGEIFKQLVDDLAMQIVACPQVEFVSIEDVPESIVKKEKELEMQREDLQSKPEDIRERIVEGRITKRLGELALLEQPFIKDDKLLIKDSVKQAVVTLGENLKVRRFTRYTLGQGN